MAPPEFGTETAVESMTEDPTTWTWMSDDPLRNFEEDPRSHYFDRTAFVTTTAGAIQAARDQSKSSVFGLIGAWGSGKTTIIASLAAQLESSNWRVHHFNPWLYSDADSLRWGFFSELREAMPSGSKWTSTRRNLEKLRDAVVPLTKLVGALGPDVSGAAEYLLNPERFSATKMRETVAKHLEKLTHPVLVVLDDLDRLTSLELLETFKLVRFIGRLPNVYYLLCYDEETLVDLLENTDLVGDRHDRRALDYLEKIVQLRFDIPPLRVDLVEKLFEVALRGVLKKNRLSLTSRDEARLVELIGSGLVTRLSTPRAIRNLFAQLDAFMPSVANEVDSVDFVLLTWIRTFEPGLYGHLQSYRDFLIHGSIGFEFDEKKAIEKRNARLQDFLERGGITAAQTPAVVNMLQALFPVVGRIANGQSTANLPRPDARRIADDFYFDRYFNFGVPADDLPDATVRKALAELGQISTPSTAALESHLASDTRRTIQKIEQERAHTPEASAAIVRWAQDQYSLLPEQNGWSTPRDQLASFLAGPLVDANIATCPDFIREALLAGNESTYMFLDSTRYLVNRHLGSGDEIRLWNQRGEMLQAEILAKLPSFINAATTKPVFDLDPSVWRLIFTLGGLDGEAATKLIRARVDDGTWSVLDVAARLVGTVVPSGSGSDAISSISEFDEDSASTFLDVPQARADLAVQISSAGELEPLRRAEASPENRRAYVLAWFKAHPAARAGAGTE
jgi:hypothetical protein